MQNNQPIPAREPLVSKAFLIALLLALLTIALYWKVSGHEFMIYDTYDYIHHNPMVKQGLSLQGTAWAFTTFYMSNWHPITWLAHMLDVQLFGLNAAGHHLVNLLVHVLSTLILFGFLNRTTRALWASAFVAMLFAIHPLHIESVAWVAERKDCLSALFGLLALWYFSRYVRRRSILCYLAALVAFSLSLMAKPMLVTLPFLLLLLDYWPMNRYAARSSAGRPGNGDTAKSVRFLVWEKVPFFLLTTAACIVAFLAQQKGGSMGGMDQFPLEMRLANALISYSEYCLKTIVPVRLSVFYPYPADIPVLKTLAAGAFVAGLSVMALISIRRRPWFVVGWFWYLGTLVPVIGIVQIGSQAMADRYTYLPSIGLFIMCAWWGREIAGHSRRLQTLVTVAALAITLSLAAVTHRHLDTWRNSVTLFSQARAVAGDNPLINYFLGAALAEQGQDARAFHYYRKALALNPEDELTHLNIGVLLQRRGRFAEAAGHYAKALQINPRSWQAHHNLGLNRMATGQIPAAINHYLAALALAPESATVHNSLAVAYIRTGAVPQAIWHLERAVSLDPAYRSARRNLDRLIKNSRVSPPVKGD